jgi:hypothetical protein
VTRSPVRRLATRVFRGVVVTAVCAVSTSAQVPALLTGAEFWRLFTTMSETGGSFASENFVSNESGFQLPIPTLQRTTRPGGVYLGVGPEQNYTYIANLQPSMAFIVDIRRQNALLHLMYKALFEMSPTRADFVGNLFARPLPRDIGPTSSAMQLFAAALLTAPNERRYRLIGDSILTLLTVRHQFPLSADDRETIRRVYQVFHDGGPSVNYSWHSVTTGRATGAAAYATYAVIQATSTAPDGVNMAFLASEEAYKRVRALHVKNLIVPVVGDFGGPRALLAVGTYLKQRAARVQAFYVSNVEEYLFRSGSADRFYESVQALPLDASSTFIRSVVGSGGVSTATFMVRSRDSAGVRVLQAVRDSGGRSAVVRSAIDSVGGSPLVLLAAQRPSGAPGYGATLAAGIGSMMETVAAFRAGRVRNFGDVSRLTRTDWR